MLYWQLLNEFSGFDFESYFNSLREPDIERSLAKESLNAFDFLNLISERAQKYLEIMAYKAQRLTMQYFGKTIGLYIPVYLSNYCSNNCLYCGFRRDNQIVRKALSRTEIAEEAEIIYKSGMRHVLILTGEDRSRTPPEYISEAVHILKYYFASVSIEVYPMNEREYMMIRQSGADGLTIYQEVYDRAQYKRLHPSCSKSDFLFRLSAPDRGAEAGFRMITIGSLLGLGEKRKEAFYTALHAKYLTDTYLDTEFSVSLPRLNSACGGFKAVDEVSDRDLVQFILAFRLFLPRSGIALSTRESAHLRDRIIPLGITRISAGSSTTVGGYHDNRNESNTPQFELSDKRSIEEVAKAVKERGYDTVFKDWDRI